MPEELTGTTFQDFVNEHDLVVVDFWASWCGPCKLVAPVIEELDEEMDGIAFGKVNVDENQDLARQYSIMSIPTLLVFKGGEMEDMLVGAMEKDVLQEKISRYR
jgi:thioredoxin 1